MAGYEFLTTWLLDAPREEVWDAIWDSEAWPGWWRSVVESTEIDPGTPCGIGRRGRYAWRSRVPYPIRFAVLSTRVERPFVIEGEASGELEGMTAALYEWSVRTTKPWMNLIAPLAAPVFRWNHDQVMRRGGRGLARHLGCRLLASS
mgnify:CR=1 FL=1